MPEVAILLSTYNGERFLTEQLDSFARQTHSGWKVWASDDGSRDGTRALLAEYQDKWPAGRLAVLDGPARGFVANFLTMTCHPDIQADYYAFSDQDDIWHADKLERALQWLGSVPNDSAALYCSRSVLVDANNHEIGVSPMCGKPSFANALVQNIAGGNTMVFNRAARALLQQAGTELPLAYHDWWAYLAVSGCGGQVLFDPVPSLRYRQHGANLVGMQTGWAARLKYLRSLLSGHESEKHDGNISALRKLNERLTPENQKKLEYFAQARELDLVSRLINLGRSGVYRQTRLGNFRLIAEALFKQL